MATIWNGARVALGIGLVALLVMGIGRGSPVGEPMLIDGGTEADALAALLVRDSTAILRYADSIAPSRKITALLASAAARGTGVTVEVPEDAGRLAVDAPERPVAGRRSALGIRLRGEPGERVTIRVGTRTGTTDSTLVTVGDDGRVVTAMAVEPTVAGDAAWTVEATSTVEAAGSADRRGDRAVAYAWVRPEAPVRVLVWTASPGWESRYLIRALEASGMDVAVREDLGRGLAVTSEEITATAALPDLAAYDVLALVGATDDSTAARARAWVTERGGGLLLSGAGGSGALAPWAPRGSAIERPASALVWTGPPEIVPLPPVEIATPAAVVPGDGTAGDGMAVASGGAQPDAPVFVRASYLGRGRIFASGMATWPWALEGGMGSAHEAFWESTVEWLAGGLSEDVLLTGPVATPWVRWEGALEGDVPAGVTLSRPQEADLSPEALPVLAGSGSTAPDARTIAFVPTTEGGYGMTSDASDGAAFGTVAPPTGDRPSWTEAALTVGGAGGRVEPGGTGAPATADPSPRPVDPSGILPWLLFLALAALAITGWTARRVAGRP